jgi:hypothetical protein
MKAASCIFRLAVAELHEAPASVLAAAQKLDCLVIIGISCMSA